MIELCLRLRARPHQAPLVGEALQSLARSARLETGCTDAQPWADIGDPDCLGYVEVWESEDALRRALCCPHFTRLVALMETAAEPPELEFRFIAETRGLEFARHVRDGERRDPSGPAGPSEDGAGI